MRIGAHVLRSGLFVAPMAGITDRPFRRLARRYGAAVAVSEMVSSRPELRESRKTRLRVDHSGEPGPIAVQIAGADPQMLADAARHNVALGAQIIDINMGCPAKKVCNVLAGSALLEDEALVARILEAVVKAVEVPVTLKIRTGPSPERRNALSVARIAEEAGVQMLAIHGRTRACAFRGHAEHETIAEVKSRLRIPVIANGDVDTPEEAKRVLEATGADGIMIGRAAQGRPWLFREISQFLATGEPAAPAAPAEIRAVLLEHLEALYQLYGEEQGTRVARKHIGWTVRALPGGDEFRCAAVRIESAAAQHSAVNDYFSRLAA
ncbi:MAG TPA: tRNA dihydrouridine synthase DusB [Burkholderiales bacterium]|jgi:tRNA-dihydrouridine synthase B|nr:tRNA dihydrouridine synthase DusB [Burkholderiales bacterium]